MGGPKNIKREYKIEGKTRQDRIRNSTFRENLKIKPTLESVEERETYKVHFLITVRWIN
jgi:hypothetical protein